MRIHLRGNFQNAPGVLWVLTLSGLHQLALLLRRQIRKLLGAFATLNRRVVLTRRGVWHSGVGENVSPFRMFGETKKMLPFKHVRPSKRASVPLNHAEDRCSKSPSEGNTLSPTNIKSTHTHTNRNVILRQQSVSAPHSCIRPRNQQICWVAKKEMRTYKSSELVRPCELTSGYFD